jgi:tetratricopeptide (TPR) repeat protein
MSYVANCFIDMPFGRKIDLASGTEIDFDHIYRTAIKPAIEEAGLEPVRGDEEQIGGIIHGAMFARLLLAEYVVADLTLANPNVFYELGIRHAAKPFTTVPIFANVHPLPFDVAMIRAIVYQLEDGKLTEEGAQNLRSGLKKRLEQAIHGAAVKDSPLFQLISGFPGIELPHEVTDVFQERVKHEEEFRAELTRAKAKPSDEERRSALLDLKGRLGELKTVQRNVLVSLMLAFRSVEAWDEMVELCEAFPDHMKGLVMVRQQWALALNRRNQPGDGDRAAEILERLVREQGTDPETLGILGRVHKDRYRDAKEKGKSLQASAALDDAIAAYTKGFESDPRDYYPGVNAINLLIQKGDPVALEEARRLVPLVSFAVARRGGATSSDYWDLATVLELACIGEDWKMAARVLPRALAAARESWMPRTTLGNLGMLRQTRAQQGESVGELDEIIRHLEERTEQMKGGESAALG